MLCARLQLTVFGPIEDSRVGTHEALQRLSDPKGCSWNPLRICLDGTRTVHIQEISTWASDFAHSDMTLPASATVGSAARVMLVGGPAGSGKSALAHTICKDMDEKGILVSSFFFSQMGQNLTSEDFMAAFIRGLSGTNHQIRHRIGEILLEKPTMASASAITQFQGLVLPVLHLLPADRTFVVGIDALDE
ncbi:hypothetical protein FA15DRAFT_606364, partial [Coprinopsis marcescibilis]